MSLCYRETSHRLGTIMKPSVKVQYSAAKLFSTGSDNEESQPVGSIHAMSDALSRRGRSVCFTKSWVRLGEWVGLNNLYNLHLVETTWRWGRCVSELGPEIAIRDSLRSEERR